MDYNRLRWACRRGMLELDLVLQPFLDNVLQNLPMEQQKQFERLLECEDQDLFNWFLRKEDPADAQDLTIVNIIRKNTGLQPEAL